MKPFAYHGNRRFDSFPNISYDPLESLLTKKTFKGGKEGTREIFFLMLPKHKMKMKRNKVIAPLQLSDQNVYVLYVYMVKNNVGR